MESSRLRAAQYISRFIPLPVIRALVRYAPTPVRTRVWDYLCADRLAPLPHRFTVRTSYGTFSGNSADMIPQYVYYFGSWEPVVSRLIDQRLGPGQTFVDVGANTGWYTVLAARKVGPSGRVVALEPSPANFSWLKENLRKNDLDNVRTVNEAAWSSEAELSLFQGPASNSGASTLVPSFAATKDCDQVGLVRARPLTAILSPDEISTMRVLKIDVEGAELEVIRGLEPILDLAPHELEIFLELNPNEYGVEDLLQPFLKRGFRAWIIPNEYGPRYYLNLSESGSQSRLEELHAAPKEQLDVLLTRTQPN
jgi:FkbM family methyltransferase